MIINIDETNTVFVDKDIAINILKNLVNNAIRFTSEGGEIQIITKDKNDFIEFSVIDNGIGINEKVQEKI